VLKTTMTAAFALMMAASLPIYAQTSTAPKSDNPPAASGTTSTAPAHSAATRIQPGQIRATEMNGATVYDTQNQKVGDVKEIILDRDGKVAAVVLDVGAFLGMGGKYVAVSMNDVKVTEDKNNKPHFAVDMTKDQLKQAQAFDLNRNDTTGGRTGSSTAPDTNRPATTR
jgi:sporulation protein YlmC with PRC-barrel domain